MDSALQPGHSDYLDPAQAEILLAHLRGDGASDCYPSGRDCRIHDGARRRLVAAGYAREVEDAERARERRDWGC